MESRKKNLDPKIDFLFLNLSIFKMTDFALHGNTETTQSISVGNISMVSIPLLSLSLSLSLCAPNFSTQCFMKHFTEADM
jgi:hypothetical protein